MKSLLVVLLFAVTICCHAQISKKTFLVSGNISYSHQRSSNNYTTSVNGQYIDVEPTYTSNSLNFSPKVGYFLSNRWCAGLSLPISFSRSTSRNSQLSYLNYTNKSRGFNAGPFIRYYIPLKPNLFVITEASYSWRRVRTTSKGEDIVGENVSKSKSQQFQAGAGLSYLLNKNVGLELLATYYKPIDDDDYYDSYNSITVGLGLQIYLSK